MSKNVKAVNNCTREVIEVKSKVCSRPTKVCSIAIWYRSASDIGLISKQR